MNKEPKYLKKGKEFHKKIQLDWLDSAKGEVKSEKFTVKPSEKKGRMDIFVKADNELVAVVEIKNTKWGYMDIKAIRRNIKRQSKQIWDYIDSQLIAEKDVSPGIIFPKRPKNYERLKLIERLFEEQGIPVVWQDETIEERRKR